MGSVSGVGSCSGVLNNLWRSRGSQRPLEVPRRVFSWEGICLFFGKSGGSLLFVWVCSFSLTECVYSFTLHLVVGGLVSSHNPPVFFCFHFTEDVLPVAQVGPFSFWLGILGLVFPLINSNKENEEKPPLRHLHRQQKQRSPLWTQTKPSLYRL